MEQVGNKHQPDLWWWWIDVARFCRSSRALQSMTRKMTRRRASFVRLVRPVWCFCRWFVVFSSGQWRIGRLWDRRKDRGLSGGKLLCCCDFTPKFDQQFLWADFLAHGSRLNDPVASMAWRNWLCCVRCCARHRKPCSTKLMAGSMASWSRGSGNLILDLPPSLKTEAAAALRENPGALPLKFFSSQISHCLQPFWFKCWTCLLWAAMKRGSSSDTKTKIRNQYIDEKHQETFCVWKGHMRKPCLQCIWETCSSFSEFQHLELEFDPETRQLWQW